MKPLKQNVYIIETEVDAFHRMRLETESGIYLVFVAVVKSYYH